MGVELHEYTIEELAAPVENALSTGPFGSAISSKFFVDSGTPVIRGSNLSVETGVRLIDDGLVFVSNEKAIEFRRSIVRHGDLVFTCWGTINQVGLIDERAKFPAYVISNKQMKLTPDPKKADSLFLYYLFSGPVKQSEILGSGIGSSVPGFNLGQLKSSIVFLPKLDMQKRIASILGTLDDKIELNRRMNRTLEAMAQAIFKSWFVDFEPVKAKAAAKASGATLEQIECAAMAAIAGKTEAELAQLPEPQQQSLAQTAALFPDTSHPSELGEIPDGWCVSVFSQLATLDTTSVKPFEAPEKSWEHYSIPAFDASHMPVYESGESIKSNKYVVKSGAILSSKLNPQFPRTWWPHLFDQESAICSTEFMQFVPVNKSEQAYIYGLITSKPFQAGISARVTGSTGSRQRAQPKQIATMEIVDSGPALRKEFVRIAGPIYEKLNANLIESRTLAQLRDTLLPKLLSGELSVSDAKSNTEEVNV